MALCIIDLENKKMQYAGANISLYIIRNNEEAKHPELIVYKPDKMPISIYKNEQSFTNHVIKLKSDDKIYIFSDGYADQFGGTKGKKFLIKRFKKLLLDNYSKSMKEQKIILSNSLCKWQGNLEQVDDILVIGMKIS